MLTKCLQYFCLQNVLQQWDGGDKPDEVCEEEKQEVVSQAWVDDNQQLGEQMPKAKNGKKWILIIIFSFFWPQKNDPGVGPAPKSWAENKTDPTNGAGCLQYVTM